MYHTEEKEYKQNSSCKSKMIRFIISKNNPSLGANEDTFSTINSSLTIEILTEFKDKIVKDKLKSFVQVRSEKTLHGSHFTYSNIPDKKDSFITQCVEVKGNPMFDRMIPDEPMMPTLLENNCSYDV